MNLLKTLGVANFIGSLFLIAGYLAGHWWAKVIKFESENS